MALIFPAMSLAQPGPQSSDTALIREEQTVTVNGENETWRVQWQKAPKQFCKPSESSLPCPCIGFAYGEAGDLFLVRLRNGTEIERLHLTPLFTELDEAVVQRWPADYDHDFELSQRTDFSSIVAKRSIVQVMRLGDYDRDGKSTEFYLQTHVLPCGKSTGVVIGVSTNNPRLHVFGTASNPTKALYLQRREWEAIRDAKSRTVSVVDWPCYDHASEIQTELQLNWSAQGVDGIQRDYTCPEKGKARRLIRRVQLSQVER